MIKNKYSLHWNLAIGDSIVYLPLRLRSYWVRVVLFNLVILKHLYLDIYIYIYIISREAEWIIALF